MNSDNIIKNISMTSRITPFRAKKVLNDLCELIIKTLNKDESVHLKGIGKFEIVKQKDQKRYDPIKEQKIMVKNAKRLKFIPSRKFKDDLNKNKKIEYLGESDKVKK